MKINKPLMWGTAEEEKMSEWQLCMQKHLVDERSKVTKLIWANRKSIVTRSLLTTVVSWKEPHNAQNIEPWAGGDTTAKGGLDEININLIQIKKSDVLSILSCFFVCKEWLLEFPLTSCLFRPVCHFNLLTLNTGFCVFFFCTIPYKLY